jgi:outer membrane protein OmpA-like peptidoglycan-associated protein/osmotically-inducible protein OsmY
MHIGGTFAAIEADLKRQTEAALNAGGQAWAKVAFSGRDATLIGEAVDNSDRLRAAGITRSVLGVRVLDDQSRLLEEEKNYVWGAQLQNDGRVRLSGFVPSPATRQAIVGAAKAIFPSRDIDDRMKLARGAPAPALWEGAISFGLKQLAGLKPGGRVDLEAANMLIEGESIDLASYRSVKSALQTGMPQGVRLRSDKVGPPVVKPYTWSARSGGSQVQLTGYVPSERARDEIFAAAKKAFPKAAVVDRLQIAAGEPKDWLQSVLASLARLGRLEEGSLDIRDAQISIAGLAVDGAAADDVRRGLKSDLPGSFKATDAIRVKEVPLKTIEPFTMTVSASNGTVTLSGYAPSPAAKVALVDAVKARLPGQRIDDRLEVANGAPEGWQRCAQAGLAGLGRLSNGRIEMSGQALALSGATDNEALSQSLAADLQSGAAQACATNVRVSFTGVSAAEFKRRADAAAAKAAADEAAAKATAEAAAAAKAAAEAAAKAAQRSAAVTPPPAPSPSQARVEADTCQALLTKVRNEGVINFKRASADLDNRSNSTLDRIAGVMATCRSAAIEVQGHTDAEGTPERNANLSNRRALSVLDYLIKAGVDSSRLTAVGYGETRPVAPNDTNENRAKNRRIEFEVKAD